MADNTTKSSGRPSNATANDILSLKTRSLHEISKFDAKMVNKLADLYSMLADIAFAKGEFKEASMTNRKSCIETLITRAEGYSKDEGLAQEAHKTLETEDNSVVDNTPVEEEETKQVANGSPVVELSFQEKKAQWEASKKLKQKKGE